METQSVSIAERSDEASVSRHVSRRDKVKIVKVYSGRIHQEIFTNLPASRQGCSQNRRKRAERSFVIQGLTSFNFSKSENMKNETPTRKMVGKKIFIS